LNKEVRSVQTAANVVVPRSDIPFRFGAYIEAPSEPALVYSVTLPNNGGTRALSYSSGNQRWQLEQTFTSLVAMDAAFPSGTYVVNVAGRSGNIAFGAEDPSRLIMTTSAGSFTNAALVVERLQPLTITVDLPANFPAASSSLYLEVTAVAPTPTLFLGAVKPDDPTSNRLSYTIPANTFAPLGVYQIRAVANRIVATDFAAIPEYILTASYTREVTLAVNVAPGTIPPTFTAQPLSQTLGNGSTVIFNAATIEATSYQWRRDGASLSGATTPTLAVIGVTAANSGAYTLVATNPFGSTTSAPAALNVQAGVVAVTARLSNLSVRATMAADQTLIVGFSVSAGSSTLLIRGIGPMLGMFGALDAMADPRLELYNNGLLIANNDNWDNTAALSAAFTGVGAFPLPGSSRDAALLTSVEGARSVHLKGSSGGVALLELFDTGSSNEPRLLNVSIRNPVGAVSNNLIVGFVIAGTGTKNLLIRAIGPKLSEFGVPNVLSDPKLDVFRAGPGQALLTNDNWEPEFAEIFNVVGAFTLTTGSRDAALAAALPAGAYTVQVSGVNNLTGEALVEIYELP
jgi:hypothetical protein